MADIIQYWDGSDWQHENPVQKQGKILAPASVAEAASINVPIGVAPTSPIIGDIWQTTDGLYYRNNAGSTVGPLGAPPALDADLVAIAALSGTSGLLRKTAADTWTLDTTTFATDSSVVHLAGTETITGSKTFTGSVNATGSSAYIYFSPQSGTNYSLLDMSTSSAKLAASSATYGESSFRALGSGLEINTGTGDVNFNVGGAVYIWSDLDISGLLILDSSDTGQASLRIPHGTAPTAPTNGDMWTTTTGSFIRINGATKTMADLESAQTFTGTKTFTTSAIKVGQTTLAQGVNGTITFPASAGTLALDGHTHSYQPLDADLTSIAGLAGTSGLLRKTAADTWSLDTNTYLTANQTITLSGDASGSGTTAITVTVSDDSHAHTGTTISALDAGDVTTGIFDIARIPTGSTGTTVSLGNHTHSYQPLDADLTSIAGLAGTSGLLRKTAADTWSLDTNTYLTANQTITLSGDASGSGTTAITVTVADNSHAHDGTTISALDAGDVTTGTFNIARIPTGTTSSTVSLGDHTHSYLSSSTSSTQDGYFGNIALYDDSTPSHYLTITNSANLTLARTLSINVNDADRTVSLSGNLTVSSAATVSGTNTGDQTITLTGDISGSGTGSFATTLATVNTNTGSWGSASSVATFTVNGKGLITAASNTAIQIAQSQVTNLTTDLAAKAPLASPALTGTPTSTTAAVDTNTTQIATTAFVIGQGYLKSATAASTYAPLASPTFTGVPAAPTAAADTNTTQLATTAFVVGQAGSANPLVNGTVAVGTSLRYSRQDHVHPTDTSRAQDSLVVHLAGTETITGIKTISYTAGDTWPLTVNINAPATWANNAGNFAQMWQNSGTNAIGVNIGDNSLAGLMTNNGYALTFGVDGTEAFRVHSGYGVVIGRGHLTDTPALTSLMAPYSSGTNIAGTNLQISSGAGTGTGGGGAIVFYTAPAGTTGATQNTQTERMRIDSSGSVLADDVRSVVLIMDAF